jgi:2,4-dienoyl-CoA reductase-like NADH-dependent reductase (Old Yellow Enzyme family)
MTSALFSPIKLADLTLANRIVVSPMCQYSADDGVGNNWHMTHLGMLANSGAALLVFEATHVERHGRITHGCLGLYSDDCEDALARIVANCRRIGQRSLASNWRMLDAKRLRSVRGKAPRRFRRMRIHGQRSALRPCRSGPAGIPRAR